MKLVIIPLFVVVTACAQTPAKIFTFNQADRDHCKVVVVGGKPLLESTFDGTSVAIAMPVKRGNTEFLVFVAVSQVADGTARIDPKEIYALYSDPVHSRFTFYDKAGEASSQARPGEDLGMSASNSQLDPSSIRPGQVMGGAPPGGGSLGGGIAGEAGPGSGTAKSGASMPSNYLRKSKVKKGDKAVGWVSLRPPRGAKLEAQANDMLDEVDIPVNGVVFRF